MSNLQQGNSKKGKKEDSGKSTLEYPKDRLRKFVKFKKISKAAFYRKISVENGYLDKSGGIGLINFKRIAKEYPDLNMDWVESGLGNMLNHDPEKEYNIDSQEVNATPEAITPALPVYDSEVFGGKRELVNTTEYEAIIGWARMPGFEDCIGWTKIKGDSMAPIVKAGDFVAVLPEIDKKFILPGALYIVSFEGDKAPHPMLKYVHLEGGKVLLRSVNKKYKDMILEISDIKAIYPARAGVVEF